MKNNLKKIKSLFIVDETPIKNEPITKEETTEVKPINLNTSYEKGIGQLDDSIFEALNKAILDNNLEGFDYLEFRDSLKQLKSILDEKTAFKSVFATVSTMGLTKEKILETAEIYLTVLANEKSKFEKAVENQSDNNIASNKAEIEKINNQIIQNNEQIQKLSDEVVAYKNKIEELKNKVAQAEQKIHDTTKNFYVTFDLVLNEIKSDIEKIKEHL